MNKKNFYKLVSYLKTYQNNYKYYKGSTINFQIHKNSFLYLKTVFGSISGGYGTNLIMQANLDLNNLFTIFKFN